MDCLNLKVGYSGPEILQASSFPADKRRFLELYLLRLQTLPATTKAFKNAQGPRMINCTCLRSLVGAQEDHALCPKML